MPESVAEPVKVDVCPIIPFGDRVVVKLVKVDKSAGGLFIPDSAQDKSQEGVVLAIGPDVRGNMLEGDRIVFAKYAGTPIKMGNQDYLVLIERDILGASREPANAD